MQPHLSNLYYSSYNIGFAKAFPRGWNVSGDLYLGDMWHFNRSESINSSINDSPSGPRPFGANLNILQMQGTGCGTFNVESVSFGNQTHKRFQFFAGATRAVIIDDVLNHKNVTAVGGVLGSPLFGVPYAADNGRRIELGLRYNF